MDNPTSRQYGLIWNCNVVITHQKILHGNSISRTPAKSDPNQPLDLELDQFSLPNWAKDSPLSHDFLNNVLPLDEAIMEVMAFTNRPWEDLHHRSSFLQDHEELENQL